MNIVGLVAEYNPFHNGHLHHLRESKKITDCEYSVCIMSGNFLQRGEPALLDKWKRSKMALNSGVDLIIELPFVYSCQSAELFALGSIKILDSLNCITHLSYGSESDDISIQKNVAGILSDEPIYFKKSLKYFLSLGNSFPKSRSLALSEYLKNNNFSNNTSNILNSSNDILGIEYLKALIKLNSNIVPSTVSRIGASHIDTSLRKNISSATSIRNAILKNGLDSVLDVIPKSSFKILREFLNQNSFNFLENYSDLFFYRFFSENLFENTYFDIDKNLANRFSNKINDSISIEDFIDKCISKNYTLGRIRRSIVHILFGLLKEEVKDFYNINEFYIKVLASNKKGFEILNKIKNNSNTTIINKLSNANIQNPVLKKMFDYDLKASNLYNLKSSKKFTLNDEYKKTPYIDLL